MNREGDKEMKQERDNENQTSEIYIAKAKDRPRNNQ